MNLRAGQCCGMVCLLTLICSTGRSSPPDKADSIPATDKTQATINLLNNSEHEKDQAIEPMAIGNTWVYQATNKDGSSWVIQRKISASREVKGETLYHYDVKLTPTDGFGPRGYDQVLRGDGVYTLIDSDDIPRKQVPKTPKVGDKWEYKSDNFTETYKVTSTEEVVTTPAGTFKCTVVVNTMVDEGGSHSAKFYFARGVGLIRTQYDDGSDEKLIKYSLVDKH